MLNPLNYTRMSTLSTKVISTKSTCLGQVIVNTAAASAILTLYNNTAGSGDVIAVIDCAAATGNPRDYHITCPNGLTAVLSGGTADVTITHEA